MNDLIWESEINIFLSPLKNLMYAIKGMLPNIIKIIEVISINALSKYPIEEL